ncbi:MAG: lipopolysaccharide/colanic/teichoic acid biosynthesis glycosyltransferase [Phenylobacterium sp.]|jgi:lipopolysaccharide/colanic/teichoic acid biosynthesis glycosyltransferase
MTQEKILQKEHDHELVPYVSLNIKIGKRLLDVSFAIVALALTALIFPFIAFAIKFESKGPIFFHQTRIGRCTNQHSSMFTMIKFRTMRTDAEKDGPQWASANDNRITRIGLFLRKTRIDELPQFINVLRGEMSVVGPRPERPVFYQKLENDIPLYSDRTYGVKPGITGLAQVNQGYDETIEDVRSKLLYDHSYALSLSKFKAWLMMDIHILYKTIMVVIGKKGQ